MDELTDAEKARAVIDTAAEAAKVLVDNATIPPWMKEHIQADHAFQEKMANEVLPTLATKKDLEGLATEKSVREVIHLYKNLEQAREILSGGGKWSYRALLVVAGLVGAVVTIVGGWKYLVALIFTPKL